MSTESPYSLTGKAGPNNSVLVTLRGDNYSELLANASAAGLGAGEIAKLYAQAFGGDTTEAAAVAAAAPITQTVLVPPSTVGTPLPQPTGVVSVPPAPPSGQTCAHGPRTYKTFVPKSGRNAGKAVGVWECAIPWSKDATGRCEGVYA